MERTAAKKDVIFYEHNRYMFRRFCRPGFDDRTLSALQDTSGRTADRSNVRIANHVPILRLNYNPFKRALPSLWKADHGQMNARSSDPLVVPAQSARFNHFDKFSEPAVVESRCIACGALVAAAQDGQYLKIAESVHRCPHT